MNPGFGITAFSWFCTVFSQPEEEIEAQLHLVQAGQASSPPGYATDFSEDTWRRGAAGPERITVFETVRYLQQSCWFAADGHVVVVHSVVQIAVCQIIMNCTGGVWCVLIGQLILWIKCIIWWTNMIYRNTWRRITFFFLRTVVNKQPYTQ